MEGPKVATISLSAPGVGRQTDVPAEESQLLLVPAPRTSMTPRGVLPAGGKGLTSDLPGSPNQPQADGRAPVTALGGSHLPPCPLAPCQPPTGFHLLTGGRSQQTTRGPAPACDSDSARLLRVGCKSPDRPQSGPWAQVPHPVAGQTVAAVSGLWPHQGQARQPSGFR